MDELFKGRFPTVANRPGADTRAAILEARSRTAASARRRCAPRRSLTAVYEPAGVLEAGSVAETVRHDGADEVLRLVLGDGARSRVALQPRDRAEHARAPVAIEPVAGAEREAHAVQARVRVELLQSRGRALIGVDAEEGLRIATVGPGETGPGEEGQLLVGPVARPGVEARERTVAPVENIGEDARAQREPILGVGDAHAGRNGAIDVPQALQPRIVGLLSSREARRKRRRETPVRVPIKIDADPAQARGAWIRAEKEPAVTCCDER